MGQVTITVEKDDLDKIEERVIELVAHHIEARNGEAILEEAQKVARERVEASVGKAVEGATRDILENGWPEMSSWGEPTSKRWTLKGHIVALLQREEGNYHHDRKKLVDRLVREATEKTINGELAEVLKEAREKFKGAIDGIIQEKLKATLKTALGL